MANKEEGLDARKQDRPHKAASQFHERLLNGEFVITAEITPPVSTELSDFVSRAATLKDLATAVNITDGAGAKVHLSNLVAAHFLIENGIEPILQMTCRDRNRLALQSDLLGALALGVRNFLALVGDDPTAGDQPGAKPVFDLGSRTLLDMVNSMRSERRLPSGTKIQGATNLVLGGADMPIDPPAQWVPEGLIAKAKAGADFVQTQFCMDTGVVRRYAARLLDLGVAQRLPILIGVAPIPSARAACWMREKLYGTLIPNETIKRLETASDPQAEGRRICVEILQELSEIRGVAGAHIMAPNNFTAIPAVIGDSGVLGKKRQDCCSPSGSKHYVS
jgi:methylenetetrahydrofolate reductase (NADPH)